MEKSRGEHPFPNDQNIDPTAPPSYSQVHHASSDSREFIPMTQSRGPPPPQAHVVYQQPSPYLQNPQTTVIVHSNPILGPHPQLITCPGCGERGTSKLIYENGTRTHLFAFMLCILGCCCFSPLPYIINSCKNTNHYCPSCNGYLGSYADYQTQRRY